MKSALALMVVLPLLAGCPLQPDVTWDSGITPDSGSTGTDAGVDGGNVASGTVSASLLTASIPSAPVIWTGTDLAFSQQDIFAGTATVDADSLDAGHLVIKLNGLAVGQRVGTPTLVSYSTPNSNEAWSCSAANANTCDALVGISSYDGITLAGNFSAQFNQPIIGTEAAALNSGVFSVTFAQ
jgi:hypothetical protein